MDDTLAGLDEPVRRYLEHALGRRTTGPAGVRLRMRGRIRVGRWLSFVAEQTFEGHAFTWRARAGWGPARPLHVTDRYAGGVGSLDGSLLGRLPFLHEEGEDVSRSAAGRAAAESVWVPATLLPGSDTRWRAESSTRIVATLSVAPERPEVTLDIDARGAVRRISMLRWGNVGRRGYGYIPFGADVHAERRFGDLILPSHVTVGWWFGTPRHGPFYEATLLAADPS